MAPERRLVTTLQAVPERRLVCLNGVGMALVWRLNGAGMAPERRWYDAWNGVSMAPEMVLIWRLNSVKMMPEKSACNTVWIGLWRAPEAALLRALNGAWTTLGMGPEAHLKRRLKWRPSSASDGLWTASEMPIRRPVMAFFRTPKWCCWCAWKWSLLNACNGVLWKNDANYIDLLQQQLFK